MRVDRSGTIVSLGAHRVVVIGALLGGLLFGCGGGRPAVGVVVVGPSGGTVTVEDKSATLQVPAGAVEGEIEITLRHGGDPGGLPLGAMAGTLIQIEPALMKFAKPVTLTIRYAGQTLPGDATWLRLARLTGGKLGSTLFVAHDPQATTLSAKIVTGGSYLLADFRLAKATVETVEQPLTDVDVLFVVDNSNSMEQEQVNLAQNFPKLIQKLEQAKIGYRVGVISNDLGAGNYSLPSCEVAGGDGGKLQNTPRVAGCIPPKDPWIEKTSSGSSNVTDTAAAFSCIAQLGTGGCGFEHQLESARRALSPGVNAGFLRQKAGLAVVFITDEDDCSAVKPQLFDPSQQGLNDPLGPLTSFRCFEFGIQCDVNGRTPGTRKSCQPASGYLQDVSGYTSFFKGLKPAGQVLLAAIAGPVEPVQVGTEGANPVLKPSCQSQNGFAVPGIRLKAVTDSMGEMGHYNTGRDGSGKSVPVDICSTDLSPALAFVGDMVTTRMLTSWCLPYRPVDTNPLTTELDADCVVTGDKVGALPACTAGATVPCYQVEASAGCGASSALLRIQNIDPLSLGAQAHATCLVL